MKIIAIKDAPVINSPQFGNGIRAYQKGEIFDVVSDFGDQVVIWNKIVNSTMSCNRENFIPLQEWRQKQLDKVI